jgi:hypothetical protein
MQPLDLIHRENLVTEYLRVQRTLVQSLASQRIGAAVSMPSDDAWEAWHDEEISRGILRVMLESIEAFERLAAQDPAFLSKAQEYRAKVKIVCTLLKGLGMDGDRISTEAKDSIEQQDAL